MNESSEKDAGNCCRPKSCCRIFPCLLIAAIIALVAYLFAFPHHQPMRRLWVPFVVETDGKQMALAETRQLEFWTPSAKTKDYLSKKNGDVENKEKWQVLSNDDAVLQFGSVLHSNQNVFGFRRIEVWGQGRTSFKPGWWWTMNVTTNYSVGDLAQMYQKFWKSQQATLIEVIDNRGTSEK